MKLRTKALIAMVATVVFMIAVQYIVSRTIVIRGFDRLEEPDVRQDLDRAFDALNNDLANLNVKISDWSNWDDTCAFIQNPNEAFINSNLTDNSLIGLQIDLMVFADNEGKIVYSKAVDETTGVETQMPVSLLECLRSHPSLIRHADPMSMRSGLIALPEEPLMVSSRPILTSNGEGPVRGALLWGRFLNDARVKTLSDVTHLALSVHSIGDPHAPDDFREAALSLSDSNPVHVGRSEELVAGYCLLNDIDGKPAFVLRAEQPRVIHHQGVVSARYFVLSLLVAGLVSGAVAMIFLQKLVLSHLVRLGSEVKSITASGDLSSRVSVRGRNEAAGLADDINGMLAALENSRRELSESQRRQKAMLDNIPDIAWLKDAEEKYIAANEAFGKMCGWKPEDLIGKTDFDCWPKEEAEKYRADDLEVMKSGTRKRFVEPNTSHEGVTTMVETIRTPIFDDQGKVIGTCGIARDVTERERMAEELRKSQEKYQAIVDNIGMGIALISPKMEILSLNRQMRDWFPEIKVQDQPICYRVYNNPPREAPCSYCPTIKTLQDGKVHEAVSSTPAGERTLNYRIVSTPLRDKKGMIVAAIEMVEDITLRKQTEASMARHTRDLAALNMKLERSNRDLEEFTYAVSHDLQEPLRKIHTFSSFLLEDAGDQLAPTCQEHIKHIQDATARMKTLIQHLLQLSRVGRDAQFGLVRSREVLDRALGTLSERIREAGGKVTVRGDLPIVIADAVQLEQVFQNLLSNALKFRAPDRAPEVAVSAEVNHDVVTFAVADNGIGIENRFLEKVFGIFQRLHTHMEYEGSGIGLALCAKIINKHGGRMWVESEFGKGSTFRFSLPRGENAK